LTTNARLCTVRFPHTATALRLCQTANLGSARWRHGCLGVTVVATHGHAPETHTYHRSGHAKRWARDPEGPVPVRF